MDIKDLVNKSSQEVRRNPDLMTIYVESFKNEFGYKPNCVGCTFNSDFIKLRKAVNSGQQTKTIKMKKETKNTFQFIDKADEILTYYVNKKPIRKYKKQADEDFVIGYLTNGTKEEIEKRKNKLRTLPKSLRPQKEVKETESMDVSTTENQTITQPKRRGRKSNK